MSGMSASSLPCSSFLPIWSVMELGWATPRLPAASYCTVYLYWKSTESLQEMITERQTARLGNRSSTQDLQVINENNKQVEMLKTIAFLFCTEFMQQLGLLYIGEHEQPSGKVFLYQNLKKKKKKSALLLRERNALRLKRKL